MNSISAYSIPGVPSLDRAISASGGIEPEELITRSAEAFGSSVSEVKMGVQKRAPLYARHTAFYFLLKGHKIHRARAAEMVGIKRSASFNSQTAFINLFETDPQFRQNVWTIFNK